MSFLARVFQVLIASPSDVEEEREIAVQTIQQWNDLNAAQRQLVLLPLRWETHSAPEYGKRPQEVINRQVVDNCDLMVGIFWTRVGSPTGKANSGTIEEIERVATSGNPVMLYFSKAKQDPEKIDVDQLAKLREFKKKTLPNALVESYTNIIEFKDKLTKQIEIKLRELLAEQSEAEMGETSIRPVTDIVFHFADIEKGHDAGSEIEIETSFFEIEDFDEIPDYVPPKSEDSSETPQQALLGYAVSGNLANKDYYRQNVTYFLWRTFYKPIRFWLKNQGGIGARDIYIDINFKSGTKNMILLSQSSVPSSHPDKFGTGHSGWLLATHASRPEEVIRGGSESWSSYIEVKALQPQRELSPTPELIVGSPESCDVTIAARIYADTLPEPVLQELKLRLKVSRHKIKAKTVIERMFPHDVIAE